MQAGDSGATPGESIGFRPRGAVWSARHPVKVEVVGSNPIEDASFDLVNRHGTQIGKAAKLKPLWFGGSTPSRANGSPVRMARSSIGLGHQPFTLKRRVRFPHGSLDWPSGGMEDTRRLERRAQLGRGSSSLPLVIEGTP